VEHDVRRIGKNNLAPNCPSLRPSRCRTVVVLVITHEEIRTRMALTESTTPATEKPGKSDFLSTQLFMIKAKYHYRWMFY
jgi:hypothetical protein